MKLKWVRNCWTHRSRRWNDLWSRMHQIRHHCIVWRCDYMQTQQCAGVSAKDNEWSGFSRAFLVYGSPNNQVKCVVPLSLLTLHDSSDTLLLVTMLLSHCLRYNTNLQYVLSKLPWQHTEITATYIPVSTYKRTWWDIEICRPHGATKISIALAHATKMLFFQNLISFVDCYLPPNSHDIVCTPSN